MGFEDDLNELISRNKRMKEFINISNNFDDDFYSRKAKVKCFIRRHYKDNKLYKFRPLNCYSIDTVKKGIIWFSNLDLFNDIYEGKMFFSNNPSLKIDILNGEEFEFVNKKDVLEAYESIQKGAFFPTCFTEDLYNFNMWGNYADSFMGICIEYSFEEIADYSYTLNTNFWNKNDVLLYPVIYTSVEDMTQFDKVDFEKIESLNYLLEKPSEFAFEKEWRLILMTADSYENKKGIEQEFIRPTAIYLGCRVKESEELNELLKICESQNIKIYKMKEEFNNKNIIFEEINL